MPAIPPVTAAAAGPIVEDETVDMGRDEPGDCPAARRRKARSCGPRGSLLVRVGRLYARLDDLDRAVRAVRVGPVTTEIEAPVDLVYQMLAAIGQGAKSGGERAEIIEQNGDVLVCDFWTRVAMPIGSDRLVRTRERVVLLPPDRIDYEHLDGLVRGLRETITVAPHDGRTQLTYVGDYEAGSLLAFLRARLLARPAIERVMREHFADVTARAEARARWSRVFASEYSR